jgi:hypothetical protein
MEEQRQEAPQEVGADAGKQADLALLVLAVRVVAGMGAPSGAKSMLLLRGFYAPAVALANDCL